MSNPTFPILQDYLSRDTRPTIRSIPWLLIAPHEAQALKNHCGQTLKRLAERGGLSADEAVAVLRDRPWRNIGLRAAEAELSALVEEFNAQPAPTVERKPEEEIVPCVYRVGSGPSWERITIEERYSAADGSLWAVCRRSTCLNKRGEWEPEPIPSNRDDDFISRCRFRTLDEATRAALARAGEEVGR